jgi:uncharacterized protein (DUF488 family)
VKIWTIGFAGHSAEEFFGTLVEAGIERLVDVRLRNTSQLAGFAKRDDLAYFLDRLGGIEYVHEPRLAPSDELLDAYKKRGGGWAAFERGFLELMAQRRVEAAISPELFAVPTVLLCTEHEPERCHRRMVVEYLDGAWGGVTPVHL